MKKRVIFLINDLQPYDWHLQPTRQMAEILNQSDWEMACIIHQKSSQIDIPQDIEFFYLPTWKSLQFNQKIYLTLQQQFQHTPLFWEYNDLNYCLPDEGYNSTKTVLRRFKKLLKIVDSWKPDLIIGSGHVLSYFISQKFNIPLLQISRYQYFPETPSLMWWQEDLKIEKSFQLAQVFASLYDMIQQPHPIFLNQMYSGDGYLIPGIPEVEPVYSTKPFLYFGFQSDLNWDERLLNMDRKKRLKKVYIDLERISLPIDYQPYLDLLISFSERFKGQIILKVATEEMFQAVKRRNLPNVSIFNWFHSPVDFPYLDLMIYSGGEQNKYDSLFRGIPSLILPMTTEQESIGRRLESIGAGKMLKAANEPYKELKFNHRSTEYNFQVGCNFKLDVDLLITTVESLLNDDEMVDRLIEFKNKLRSAYNPDLIHDFIKKFI